MNDPHVVSLQYRLDGSGGLVVYRDPPPISWDTPDFNAELVDGRLTCTMKRHFVTAAEAKILVDGYLRVWEIEAALRREYREFHFVYEKPDVIDRNPDRTVPSVASARVSQLAVETLISVTTRDTYPDPPTRFQMDSNVAMLWNRYEGYLTKHERLLAMAYFCLTAIESDSGGRTKVSEKYQISGTILSTLGRLTGGGDEATARKLTRTSNRTPLAFQERIWIEAAIKALIQRVGEYDPQDPFPTMLTMNDLPAL